MKHGLEALSRFTEQERETFAKCCNALLCNTFIVRAIEGDRPLYRFALSNFNVFEDYLSFAGWSLRKDEQRGIITWEGPAVSGLRFSLDETLVLLVFRVLFEEKQAEISLAEELSVRQEEFQEKYKVLTGRQLNKTRIQYLLRKFKSMKLIACLGGETDPESVIILYPSIPFALDNEGIDTIHERLKELVANTQQSPAEETVGTDEPDDADSDTAREE